jgi:phosphoribosylglycinamide formyltransferase 1
MPRPLRVAVLASGEGTTLDDVATELAAEPDRVRIVLVVSDRERAGVLERARRHRIPTEVIRSRGPGSEGWSDRLSARLTDVGTDVVLLAGYLSILPADWVERWRGRALNLHPSLLPKYGGKGMHGLHVHEAVLAGGETETGATVHLVTGTVDGGPPIRQERMSVRPDDTATTLRARLHPVEVHLVANVFRDFADGALPLPYPPDAVRTDRSRRD